MVDTDSATQLVLHAVVLLAFLAAALPVSLIFFPLSRAVYFTAVLSSLVALVSAVLHVLTSLPLLVVWVSLSAAGWVAAGVVPAARRRMLDNLRRRESGRDYAQLAIVAALVVIIVALVPAPLGWDARSIWLFHASWLNGPASDYLAGMVLDETVFSHPDYPLLAPSAVAVTWVIAGGSENLILGIRAIALITLLGAALAASVILKHLSSATNAVVSAAGFVLAVTSVYAIAGGGMNDGNVDPLQAVTLVLLAALLLTLLGRRIGIADAIVLSVVALVAINVKQEGFVFAVAIFAVYLVVSFRDQYPLKYVPLAVTALGYGLWKLFLAGVGSHETSDASGIVGHLPELFQPGSTGLGILQLLASNEGAEHVLPLFVYVVAGLVSLVLLNREHVRLAIFLGTTWLGLTAVIMLTYALGDARERIQWWLDTSFVRVTGTLQLLTWFIVLIVVIHAAGSVLSRTPETDSRKQE